MSFTAHERETVIVSSDGDAAVRIWTAQRKFINRLRKDQRFTELRSGITDGTEWAEFEIPATDWNPVSGAKRKRSLTDEQRREVAERLRRGRKGS